MRRAGVLVVLGALLLTGCGGEAGSGSSATEPFRLVAGAPSEASGAGGTAKLARDAEQDTTTLRVDVTGLVPLATYPVHLHLGGCSESTGEHYVHADAAQWNAELVIDLRADGAGRLVGERQRGWLLPREVEVSAIIHDRSVDVPILCAPL